MPIKSFKVEGKSALKGRMCMPGDKSISHRAVILAALADGTSTIRDLLESTDVLATVSAFRQLGVKIEGPRDGALRVNGVGLDGLSAPTRPLDMGNSGTAMRLLAGVLVGQDFESTLVGDASLSQRPMGRIIDPLTRMGAKISGVQDDTPPLKIRPTKALRAIDYSMPVASGQVGRQPIKIEGRGRRSACEITVPGDLSSAAFFVVGATISEGSSVRLENIGINGTRSGVLDILREMGANIQFESKRVICGEEVADLVISHSSLNGISIGPELVSRSKDEFPAIAIAAACATGRTTIRGAEELRVKETDRIRAVVQGLNTLNIEAVELEDGMVITGGELKSGNVNSFQDHRIAMAFSIAGAATQGSIRIADCGNVETSFPDFVSQAAGCGLNIIEQPGDIA